MVSFSTLFWIVFALLGANVGVAVIAIAKAYRDERPYYETSRPHYSNPSRPAQWLWGRAVIFS
jgi:hypothetical protein